MSKTEQFLVSYLDAIGVEGYTIHAAQDDMGFLLTVNIPRANNKKIGVLKGKDGQNLQLLKKLLRIVGVLERKTPFLVIRLCD
jgi:predicted RNA-binding protein YlqC (UPF0109 family)